MNKAKDILAVILMALAVFLMINIDALAYDDGGNLYDTEVERQEIEQIIEEAQQNMIDEMEMQQALERRNTRRFIERRDN